MKIAGLEPTGTKAYEHLVVTYIMVSPSQVHLGAKSGTLLVKSMYSYSACTIDWVRADDKTMEIQL